MNIFRPKLHYSKELVTLSKDGNIMIDTNNIYLDRTRSLMERFQRDLQLFGSNQPWISLYKEYKGNYLTYDLYPQLFYFRALVWVIQAYPEISTLGFEVRYLKPDPQISDWIDITPEVFRIPKAAKRILMGLYEKTSPYFTRELHIEDFNYFLEYSFLSNWIIYKEQPQKFLRDYVNHILDLFKDRAGDNLQTINNIIDRALHEEEAKQ